VTLLDVRASKGPEFTGIECEDLSERTTGRREDSIMKVGTRQEIPHEVEQQSCRAQSSERQARTPLIVTTSLSNQRGPDVFQASCASKDEESAASSAADRGEDREEETEADLDVLLDLDKDPFTEPGTGPSPEWLDALGRIRPRQLEVPEPSCQAAKVRELLSEIEREPAQPSPDSVRETEEAIRGLHQRIPDADKFVAGSFQAYLPAWQELLASSKRASSKKVLTWLKHGFTPKFVGTSQASDKNKTAVRAMLRRVMSSQDTEQFLAGKFPGRVEFQNHKSFYVHWDFSSKEVANLATVGAASILPLDADKPVLVHPFGVALTAGKRRLICDARGLNVFL
jgi:hypothetical protein